MFSFRRTITLLATCALAICLCAPAAALAQGGGESDAGVNYELDVPNAGQNENDQGDVPAGAADSADDGGLPILLIILAGTALAGATIAIMRRQKS
jgi:hypothetical protein